MNLSYYEQHGTRLYLLILIGLICILKWLSRTKKNVCLNLVNCICTKNIILHTGGPRYMREIGAPKIGLNIMNLHIKRLRI